MKKLLVAVLALASVSAFANHKNLVSFDGSTLSHFAKYMLGNETTNTDGTTSEVSGLDLRVNYAWAVHSNIFVGGILGYTNTKTENNAGTTTAKDKGVDYGIRVIYDFSNDHVNSMYAGLTYFIDNSENNTGVKREEKVTTISFGKRYANIAQLAGANVTFSPSIDYEMGKYGKASKTTDGLKDRSSIVLNIVKFDVLF